MANLRYVFIGVAVSLAITVLVGLVLSPVWEVELSTVVRAEPAAVHRFVSRFEEWGRWAQWSEAEDPGVQLIAGVEDGRPVQRVRARGGERAKLVMQEVTPLGVEVRVDGRINGVQTIRYERTGPESTRIVWRDRGQVELPLLGGLVAWDVANRLEEHHETALRKLKALAESVGPGAAP